MGSDSTNIMEFSVEILNGLEDVIMLENIFNTLCLKGAT